MSQHAPLFTISLLALGLSFAACGGGDDPVPHGPSGDPDAPSSGDADAPDATEPDAVEPDAVEPDTAAPEPEPGSLAPASGDDNFAVAQAGWLRGDLHYHTDFSDDARQQGGDPLAICLDIADYYRHPDFVGAWPHLAGNGMDFVAITDHRQDTAITDPGFTHEHLVLVPGEEYGGGGHGNIFGLQQHIAHQPQAGESQNQRHRDAISEAHGQGAIFSINHPLDGNNWVWDTPEVDAIEVVNGPWAGFYVGSTWERLEAAIASGVENPFIRDAQEHGGLGHNGRAVRFWQNHLTAGLHVAPIGGSDRHMIVPVGLPTTYVRQPDDPRWDGKVGPELGHEAIVEGIRRRGTFISRSPFGPQVVLEAEGEDGVRYPLGAALPGVGTYRIHVEISRADGGRLQLIAGPLLPPDEGGRVRAQPEVVWEQSIGQGRHSGWFDWTVPPTGGWLHAFVLEPLVPEPLDALLEDALEDFRQPREDDALVMMANALFPLIDINVLLDPFLCDHADWHPQRPQCVTADRVTLATFHLPDVLVRLVNIHFEGDEPTDWCFGALTSAFLARPDAR